MSVSEQPTNPKYRWPDESELLGPDAFIHETPVNEVIRRWFREKREALQAKREARRSGA